MNHRRYLLPCLLLAMLAFVIAPVRADDAKPTKITLAEGKISLAMPKTWEKVKPASNIVEYEFSAPGPEGHAAARVTIMGAGGSVEANIDRWKKQFVNADAEALKVEETKIAGQEVHMADFSGTYNDARGPFVPGVERENYRMLAAIVVTDKLGQYFIKAYGPQETMAANAEAFREMIKTLEVK